MAENKLSMPSGMGGLTRYFEDYESKISLTPTHIIVMIVLFIAFELVIRVL